MKDTWVTFFCLIGWLVFGMAFGHYILSPVLQYLGWL